MYLGPANLIELTTFRPIGIRARHVSMFQLFVAPTAFQGWGEHDYDGTAERQLLAMLIVGVGALALILCVALLMLFADQPAGPPAQSRFPIPAYLFSFAALRDTRLGRVLINRDW
jgi:hypothetical protein